MGETENKHRRASLTNIQLLHKHRRVAAEAAARNDAEEERSVARGGADRCDVRFERPGGANGGGGGGIGNPLSRLFGGGGKQRQQEQQQEMVVVTLVVAARGTVALPDAGGSSGGGGGGGGAAAPRAALRGALRQLGGLAASQLIGVELLWAPDAAEDFLSAEDVRKGALLVESGGKQRGSRWSRECRREEEFQVVLCWRLANHRRPCFALLLTKHLLHHYPSTTPHTNRLP